MAKDGNKDGNKYLANNKVYNIPEDKKDAFFKDFPDASQIGDTVSFSVNDKSYSIPSGKVSFFLNDFPDAQVVKKKEDGKSISEAQSPLQENKQDAFQEDKSKKNVELETSQHATTKNAPNLDKDNSNAQPSFPEIQRQERPEFDRNIPQPEIKVSPVDVQKKVIEELTDFNKTLTAGQYQYYMNAHPWVRESLESPLFTEDGTTWISQTGKNANGDDVEMDIVIPMVYEGKQLTQEQAVGLYNEKTQQGVRWGIPFTNEEQAANFSKALKNKSAQMQKTQKLQVPETQSYGYMGAEEQDVPSITKMEYDARKYSGMVSSLSQSSIDEIMEESQSPTNYSNLLGGKTPITQSDGGTMYPTGGQNLIKRSDATKTRFSNDDRKGQYEATKKEYGAKATALKHDYEVKQVDINDVYFRTTEFGDKIYFDTNDGMEVYPENGSFNKYVYEGDAADFYGTALGDGSLFAKLTNAMVYSDLYNNEVNMLDGGKIEMGALQSSRQASLRYDPSGWDKFISDALPVIVDLPLFHITGASTGGMAKGVSKLMVGGATKITGGSFGAGMKAFELGLKKGGFETLLRANQGGMILGNYNAMTNVARQVIDENRTIDEIALTETLVAFEHGYLTGAFAGGVGHVSSQFVKSVANKIKNPIVSKATLYAGQGGTTVIEGGAFYGTTSLLNGEPMSLEGFAHTVATFGVLKLTNAPIGTAGRQRFEPYSDYINRMKVEGREIEISLMDGKPMDIEITPREKLILSEQKVRDFKDPKTLTQSELEKITSNPNIPLTVQVKILAARGITTNPAVFKRSTTMKANTVNKNGQITVETRLGNGQLVEVREFDNQQEAAAHAYEIGHRVKVHQIEDMAFKIEQNGDALLEVEAMLGEKKSEFENALAEINNTQFVKNVSPETIAKLGELHKILKEVSDRFSASYTQDGKLVEKEVIYATIETATEKEELNNIEIKNDRDASRTLELKLEELDKTQETDKTTKESDAKTKEDIKAETGQEFKTEAEVEIDVKPEIIEKKTGEKDIEAKSESTKEVPKEKVEIKEEEISQEAGKETVVPKETQQKNLDLAKEAQSESIKKQADAKSEKLRKDKSEKAEEEFNDAVQEKTDEVMRNIEKDYDAKITVEGQEFSIKKQAGKKIDIFAKNLKGEYVNIDYIDGVAKYNKKFKAMLKEKAAKQFFKRNESVVDVSYKEIQRFKERKQEEINNRIDEEVRAEVAEFIDIKNKTYEESTEQGKINFSKKIDERINKTLKKVKSFEKIDELIKNVKKENWFKRESKETRKFIELKLRDLASEKFRDIKQTKEKTPTQANPDKKVVDTHKVMKGQAKELEKQDKISRKDAINYMKKGLLNLVGDSKSAQKGLNDIRAALEKGGVRNSFLTTGEYDRLITKIGKTDVNNTNSINKTKRYVKNAIRKATQRQVLSEVNEIMSSAKKVFTIKTKDNKLIGTQDEYDVKVSGEKIAVSEKFEIEKISTRKEQKINEISDAVLEKDNVNTLVSEYAALEVAEAHANYQNAQKQADVFFIARDIASGKKLSKAKQETYKNNRDEINTLVKEMQVSNIAETLYDGVRIREALGTDKFTKLVKEKLSKEDFDIFKSNKAKIKEMMKLIEEDGILSTPGAETMEAALEDAKMSKTTMEAMNAQWVHDRVEFHKDKIERLNKSKNTVENAINEGRSEDINEITTNSMEVLAGKSGDTPVSKAEISKVRATLEREFRDSDVFLELSKKQQKDIINKIQNIKGSTISELKDSMTKTMQKYARKPKVKFASIHLTGGLGNFESYISMLGHWNTRLRAQVVDAVVNPYQQSYRNWEKVQSLLIDLNKKSNKVINQLNGATKDGKYGVTIIDKDGKPINDYNEMSPFQIAAIYNKFKDASHTASINAKHGGLGANQLRIHTERMVERYPFIEKLADIELTAGKAFFPYENKALQAEYGIGMDRQENYTTRNVERGGGESQPTQSGVSRYAYPKNALVRMRVNSKIDLINESSYGNTQKIGKSTSDAQFLSAQNNFYNILTDKQFATTMKSSESGTKLLGTLRKYYENMPDIKARDWSKAETKAEKLYLNIVISNLALPNFVVPFGQTTSAINFAQSYTGSSIIGYKHIEAISGAIRNLGREHSNFKDFHKQFWNHPAIKMRMYKSGTIDPSLSKFSESKLFHYSDKVDSWIVSAKEASMIGIKYGDITAWVGAYPTWSRVVNEGIAKGLSPEKAHSEATDYIVEKGLQSQQSNYAINQSPFQMWGKLGAAVPYFTTPLQHQQRIINGLHKAMGQASTARERSQGIGQILHFTITAPVLYYGSRYLMGAAKLNDDQWDEQNRLLKEKWSDMDNEEMALAIFAFGAYGTLQGVPLLSGAAQNTAERLVLDRDYGISYGSMGMATETAELFVKTYKTLNDPDFNWSSMSDIEKSLLMESVAKLAKTTGFNTTALMNIIQKAEYGTTYPEVKRSRGRNTRSTNKGSTRKKM